MDVPEFKTWEEAFSFAHDECMRSFEALSHGDFDIARALNQSGAEANRIAKKIHEGWND